jgi:hypothetical protein
MIPLLLAGAGAASTLLSSMFGSNAQDEVNNARQAAYSAERARQGELDTEAAGVNRGALNRYSGFGGQMADRGASLADMFRQAVGSGNVLPGSAMPTTQNEMVANEIARQRSIVDAYGTQQADARGNLQSFGDLMGTIGRGQARDAGTIGQIGGYKKGSAGVNQLELNAANHAGDSERQLSDLFAGLGKVALTAGLGGSFAPLAAAATPAATAANVFATGASPFLTYGR